MNPFNEVLFKFGKRGNDMGNLTEWLLSTAIKKLIKRGVLIVIAYISAPHVAALLSQAGVTVDFDKFQEFAALTAWGLLETARGFLKTKTGITWL